MHQRLKGVLIVALALIPLPARAEEPAAKKPIGTWERNSPVGKVKLQATADHLVLTVDAGVGIKVVVHGDYGVTKDGILFGICTKAEKEGTDQGPKVGDLFSFRVIVDKDKLTVSEVKPGGDDAKETLQGEYKLVPEKK